MSTQANPADKQIMETLCLAYRAAVVNPPYDEADEALLRAAGRPVNRSWVRPSVYAAAALLVAALGLVVFLGIGVPRWLPIAGGAAGLSNVVRYFTEGSSHAKVPLPRTVVPQPVSSASAQVLTSGGSGQTTPEQAAAIPKPSDFLLEPLKAAQAAMKAGGAAARSGDTQVAGEETQVEIQNLQVAQAASGKTAYDEFLINAMLGAAYAGGHQYEQAAPVLEAAAQSQYSNSAQKAAWMKAAVSIYSQLHQYPKAIESAQTAIRMGVADPSVYVTMAVDQDSSGQHAEAAQTIQQLIDREPKPEEKYLIFQWNAYSKANDNADAARVAQELCLYYRRPGFCPAH